MSHMFFNDRTPVAKWFCGINSVPLFVGCVWRHYFTEHSEAVFQKPTLVSTLPPPNTKPKYELTTEFPMSYLGRCPYCGRRGSQFVFLDVVDFGNHTPRLRGDWHLTSLLLSSV